MRVRRSKYSLLLSKNNNKGEIKGRGGGGGGRSLKQSEGPEGLAELDGCKKKV